MEEKNLHVHCNEQQIRGENIDSIKLTDSFSRKVFIIIVLAVRNFLILAGLISIVMEFIIPYYTSASHNSASTDVSGIGGAIAELVIVGFFTYVVWLLFLFLEGRLLRRKWVAKFLFFIALTPVIGAAIVFC